MSGACITALMKAGQEWRKFEEELLSRGFVVTPEIKEAYDNTIKNKIYDIGVLCDHVLGEVYG